MGHPDWYEKEFVKRTERQVRGTDEFSIARKAGAFKHRFSDHETRVLVVLDGTISRPEPTVAEYADLNTAEVGELTRVLSKLRLIEYDGDGWIQTGPGTQIAELHAHRGGYNDYANKAATADNRQ